MFLASTNPVALVQDVNLLVMKRFNDKFLSLPLSRPLDGSLRSPNLQEILAADRTVWAAVTTLMRDFSWSLPDALNEVAFCRQDMTSALQPRPKPVAPPPAPHPVARPPANPRKRDEASAKLSDVNPTAKAKVKALAKTY